MGFEPTTNCLRGNCSTAELTALFNKWHPRQESNPQPPGPKPGALSIELRGQIILVLNVRLLQDSATGKFLLKFPSAPARHRRACASFAFHPLKPPTSWSEASRDIRFTTEASQEDYTLKPVISQRLSSSNFWRYFFENSQSFFKSSLADFVLSRSYHSTTNLIAVISLSR